MSTHLSSSLEIILDGKVKLEAPNHENKIGAALYCK
jgi:hypothetical protein